MVSLCTHGDVRVDSVEAHGHVQVLINPACVLFPDARAVLPSERSQTHHASHADDRMCVNVLRGADACRPDVCVCALACVAQRVPVPVSGVAFAREHGTRSVCMPPAAGAAAPDTCPCKNCDCGQPFEAFFVTPVSRRVLRYLSLFCCLSRCP